MGGKLSRAGVTRARLMLLVLVVLGLMIAPASAQADPVEAEDCTAQLEATGAQPPEPTLRFTIVCENRAIVGTTFRTTQGAVIPGFQAENANPEENPLQGLNCLPPAGEEFNCGGRLEAGTIGRADIGTEEDPCVTGFEIRDLTLDTDPEGPPGSEPPVPDEEDVVFNQAIPLQGCPPEETPSGDGGGGGDQGGAGEECPDGEGEGEQHRNQDRERGEFEGEHFHSGSDENEECPDGNPEGGVDAGFGGDAELSSTGGSSGGVPLVAGAVSLILLGLLGGALTLARR